MKILVTGGDGYIGSKLIIRLKNLGHEVISFDRPKDISNAEQLEQALDTVDCVYHLAALAEINYTDKHPAETFQTNIAALKTLVEICTRRKIFFNFASTCCIYGNPLETPSIEDSLINPTDFYAMTKAAGEWIVKAWGLQGLKYTILRFGTVYGPGTNKDQRRDMAIQIFLQAAIEQKGINITGDGGQNRNFIHIDDLTNGLCLVSEKMAMIEGQTINFAGAEKITVNQIARFALENGATGITHVPARKDDFRDQDVSNEKAKVLLGWEPKVDFERGLTDFYLWLKYRS